MNRNLILFQVLGISAIVAVLHYAAITYSLYFFLWWFDVLTHFLGGFLIGLLGLWLVFYSDYDKRLNILRKYHPAAIIFVSVFVVGILWELFELFAGVPRAANFVEDTVIDLIMDMVGAGASYLYFTLCNPKTEEGRTEV